MTKLGKRKQSGEDGGDLTQRKQSKAYRNQPILADGQPNTQQVNKEIIDALTNTDMYNQLRDVLSGELIQVFRKFYSNIIKIEGDDELVDIGTYVAFGMFYMGSGCVIHSRKYGLIVAGVKDPRYVGYSQDIQRYTAMILQTSAVDEKAGMGRININEKDAVEYPVIEGSNGAYFQCDIGKMPFIVRLEEMLKPMIETMVLMTPEIQNAIVKLLFTIPRDMIGNEIKREEVLKLLKADRSGNMAKVLLHKIEVQELKSETINDKLGGHVKKWYDFINLIRGRKVNINDKKERNTDDEVRMNLEQFEVVVDDYLMWVEKFVRSWNKGKGRNAKVTIRYREEIDLQDTKVEARKDADERPTK